VPAEQGWPSCLGPHRPLTQAWPVAQSASVRQTLLQAPSTQLKGLQFWTPCGLQVPRPSQVPGVLRRVPVQLGGMHWVSAGYFAQPPNPSHVPFAPHEGAPMSLQIARGSGRPWSIGQQVPRRPGSAHETQPPEQATLQQMPSAQKPEAQSVFALQVAPFIFKPQLEFTHCWLPAHWLVCVHESKQAPVVWSQENGAQMTVGPGRQRPMPSHAWAPTTASPSHMPGPQAVPAVYLRQAPAPSHLPSKPQVVTSAVWHAVESRGAMPAGMNVHVPIVAEQVWQGSVQATLQHTPSTQKPLEQSPGHLQAWPLAFFVSAASPQEPASEAGVSAGASAASTPPLEPAVPLPPWPAEPSWPCVAGELLPHPAAAIARAAATIKEARPDKPQQFMSR
jgi:hypothetical protein